MNYTPCTSLFPPFTFHRALSMWKSNTNCTIDNGRTIYLTILLPAAAHNAQGSVGDWHGSRETRIVSTRVDSRYLSVVRPSRGSTPPPSELKEKDSVLSTSARVDYYHQARMITIDFSYFREFRKQKIKNEIKKVTRRLFFTRFFFQTDKTNEWLANRDSGSRSVPCGGCVGYTVLRIV